MTVNNDLPKCYHFLTFYCFFAHDSGSVISYWSGGGVVNTARLLGECLVGY